MPRSQSLAWCHAGPSDGEGGRASEGLLASCLTLNNFAFSWAWGSARRKRRGLREFLPNRNLVNARSLGGVSIPGQLPGANPKAAPASRSSLERSSLPTPKCLHQWALEPQREKFRSVLPRRPRTREAPQEETGFNLKQNYQNPEEFLV